MGDGNGVITSEADIQINTSYTLTVGGNLNLLVITPKERCYFWSLFHLNI